MTEPLLKGLDMLNLNVIADDVIACIHANYLSDVLEITDKTLQELNQTKRPYLQADGFHRLMTNAAAVAFFLRDKQRFRRFMRLANLCHTHRPTYNSMTRTDFEVIKIIRWLYSRPKPVRKVVSNRLKRFLVKCGVSYDSKMTTYVQTARLQPELSIACTYEPLLATTP